MAVVRPLKPIVFEGRSLDDIRDFPQEARREAGHQLDRVQRGLLPNDWKPMGSIGRGVMEIRIHDAQGEFRVVYLARLADAVHVLHGFQKKTQRTSPADLRIAQARLAALLGRTP